jgi:hypothetical protein
MKLQELFSDSGKWTQGADAKDCFGDVVQFHSDSAESWCVGGALNKCYPDFSEMAKTMRKIVEYLDIHSISVWNDSPERKFDDIVRLCKDLDI